ncbi:MAG: adenylate/guanylate cyclase domain-containing protein [Actinomycetota bacterium]|nr:adenylate/guanylate cyclase domain-containing protein [Actinomycetota bacterium]
MKIPETRYARSGDVSIAYQTVGDGPTDLVYAPGIWSNVEIMWEDPSWNRFLTRLASFSRLIVFDMRGIGVSDRGKDAPVLELQRDDVGAVMDALGSRSAVIFGVARGAAMTLLFAATHPERTKALILYAPVARTLLAPDFPFGRTLQEQEAFYERFVREVGTGRNLALQAPSVAGDERFRSWWARFERLVATPSAYRELGAVLFEVDVRPILSSVQAPTLVLHRRDDPIVDLGQGRYVAEHIPGAEFVELPGGDHIPFIGDQEAILAEIEEFVTGARPAPDLERLLTTVLFTDIVGSTQLAAREGDRRWKALLEQHHETVRRELERFRGVEIDTAGDGFLASFDGPARAVRCALAVREAVGALGLEVRSGVHTGECELIGNKIGGIAVHIGARVAALAEPGQVLVSSTLKDLVAGSGLSFEDRGEHELKGVPDRRRLFRVLE